MSEAVDLQPIKEKLEGKGSIFVLFGQNATIDHVGSALALYLTLKQAGSDVLVASPAEMRAEFTYLVGLNKIGKSIGNRNLVISFKDYTGGSIEKVSHNDDINNKFELTIQPKSGHKAPNPKNIEYSYTGAQADLIFVIGTNRLEDLGSIYESETNVFNTATTVAINRRNSSSYAQINVIDNQASSLAEITAELLEKLELSVQGDAASNLLAGIDFATNRFQNPVVSPTAFSMAGKLMQQGAKRQPQRIGSSPTAGFPSRPSTIGGLAHNQSFAQALAGSSLPSASFPSVTSTSPLASTSPIIQSSVNQPLPVPQANSTGTNQQSSSNQSSKSSSQSEPQPQADNDQSTSAVPTNESAPSDWTQPKIYKGSTRV